MELKFISICPAEYLPLLRRGAQTFARRTGHEVIWGSYTRPEEFFPSVRKQWGLALVLWPGDRGLALVRRIRKENHTIPLLWISDDSALAVHGYPLGAKSVLCQPVDDRQIAAALAQCTHTHQAAQA